MTAERTMTNTGNDNESKVPEANAATPSAGRDGARQTPQGGTRRRDRHLNAAEHWQSDKHDETGDAEQAHSYRRCKVLVVENFYCVSENVGSWPDSSPRVSGHDGLHHGVVVNAGGNRGVAGACTERLSYCRHEPWQH